MPRAAEVGLLDFQDEATLFLLAQEFLDAATTLHEAPMARIKFKYAALYVTCHAAELILKSFLYKQGETIQGLKNEFGHDLRKLLRRARAEGLPDRLSTTSLESVSGAYKAKLLQYHQRGHVLGIEADKVLLEVQAVSDHVFGVVADL